MRRLAKKTHQTWDYYLGHEIHYYRFRGEWYADIPPTDIMPPVIVRAHYKREVVDSARAYAKRYYGPSPSGASKNFQVP